MSTDPSHHVFEVHSFLHIGIGDMAKPPYTDDLLKAAHVEHLETSNIDFKKCPGLSAVQ